MGCSAAFHLAEFGLDTVLVDRTSPGSEASGANAGTLAVQNKPTGMIPLVQPAVDLWESLSERLGMDVEYERRGGFRVAHTEEDIARLETVVERERRGGIELEMVFPPQLHREAPYLSPKITAASYCAKDGMANPFTTTRAFLTAARRNGARFLSDTEVTGIDPIEGAGFMVKTTAGAIRCVEIISAAGTWNAAIARMVGIEIPVHGVILTVSISEPGPSVFQHIVSHVRENLTLKQQRTTGKMLIGGGWPGEGDPEKHIKRIRRDTLIGNLKWATEVIPVIGNTRILRSWTGFEGRTPDKMLICGPIGPPGFYVLGCSYSGFTLSPLAGRIAAEQIAHGASSISWETFNVKRFASEPPEAGRD
jgi:glycine/D-amino acid oxidase-like deaminating enzyme